MTTTDSTGGRGDELERQVAEAKARLRMGLAQQGHTAEQQAQAAYRFLSAHYLERIALALERNR